MSELVDCNEGVKTQEETIEIFGKQLDNLKSKMRSLEKEIDLASEFKGKAEIKLSECEEKKRKCETSLAVIEETIDSLNKEKTKTLIFLHHFNN
jgi:chromosome segregation ATPase